MATTTQINLDAMVNEVEFAGLTEEQKAELVRRMASFKKDPTQAIPWKQVKATIQKNLREIKRARS